jgi:hypothetical protein
VGGTAASFHWEVVAAPDGAQAAPVPADAASTEFTPDVDGSYTLRLTVTDAQGGSASCDAALVARFKGLRAAVQWTAGPFTVELHVIDPKAVKWFGARDCFPGACNADWGTTGDPLDDPQIQVDLSGQTPFDFVEVPRVTAQAGEVFSVAFFVKPILDNVVNAAAGSIAIQCGEDDPVALNFQNAVEGAFVKVFDLAWRADGGCDPTVVGGGAGIVVSEDQARAAR